MLKGYHIVVLENSNEVQKAMCLAGKYGLDFLYKIGVYGTSTQHEFYVKGNYFNYYKFTNELNEALNTEKNVTE